MTRHLRYLDVRQIDGVDGIGVGLDGWGLALGLVCFVWMLGFGLVWSGFGPVGPVFRSFLI